MSSFLLNLCHIFFYLKLWFDSDCTDGIFSKGCLCFQRGCYHWGNFHFSPDTIESLDSTRSLGARGEESRTLMIDYCCDRWHMWSVFSFQIWKLLPWKMVHPWGFIEEDDIVSTYNGESLHSSEPGDNSQDDLWDKCIWEMGIKRTLLMHLMTRRRKCK